MTEAEKIIDEKRRKKIKDLADLSRQVDEKYGKDDYPFSTYNPSQRMWDSEKGRAYQKARYAQGITGMVGSILDIKGSNTEKLRKEYKSYGGDKPSITDIIKRLIALKDEDAGTDLTEEERKFERVHGGSSEEMGRVKMKKKFEDSRKKTKTKKHVATY